MKLDVIGKQIEVSRENDAWIIYEIGEGKRSRSNDIYIPSEYNETQVLEYLEDMLHERATPERPRIKVIE